MPAPQLFLGIDQGSSATKGAVVDSAGTILHELHEPVPERKEAGERVEQDPNGILESVVRVIDRSRRWAQGQGLQVSAAGLAVQRSGVLAWNGTDGRVRHPMLTWADTRTSPIIKDFGRGVERISAKTGLPTIPHFAAGKIHLLQRQFLEPSVLVATLDSFLIHRLGGKKSFITEDTMAARTMLYALSERGWSADLCREFAVDASRLPEIRASIADHGSYDSLPILALLGDQQAALIGRLGPQGRALLNIGTIASLTKDTGASPVQKTGLMTSVLLSRVSPDGSSRDLRFLVEATSPVTGAALLEPLRRGWCASSEELNALCESSLAECPEGRAIGYFVGHRAASPSSDAKLPNVMACKSGASVADRARAVVENVGNIIVRMIEEFSDKGLLGRSVPAEIDVAGGGSETPFLLQYVADVSGHALCRLPSREAGTRGAALCAMMHGQQGLEAAGLNSEGAEHVYRCERPERRRRHMMWLRLEQDVMRGTLPPHAEVEP